MAKETYDFYEKPSANTFIFGHLISPKSKIEIPSYSLKNRIETGNFHKQNISLHGKDISPGIVELNDELSWGSIYSKINDITVKTESKNWDMWLTEEDHGVNILSWGSNNHGQLGNNNITSYSSPILIAGNHEFIDVAHGSKYINYFMAGLKADGSAWTWGRNEYGQLGNNTRTNYSSPVSVVGNHSFIQISVGENNTLALKKDGLAWAWGNNNSGQLGDNTITSQSSPILIAGNHSFIKIVAGHTACAGLKKDGSVWTWGLNAGRLGDNTTDDKSSPVLVAGSHSFISLSGTGAYFICLKENGEAWGWGFNTYGRLGTGTSGDIYSSPVSLIGNHSFKYLNCGLFSALALKEDGSAWAWGYNAYGALGDNTVTDRSSPISIVGNHSFVQISAGSESLFALKKDGTLWAWGRNTYGQLGDGTQTHKSSPTLFPFNYKFTQIRGGNYYTFGISPRLSQPAKALRNIANSENNEKKIILTSNYEDMSSPFTTWKYRQKITIDYTKVPNTDQEDFPVLVSISNEENQVFKKAMANGSDIYFADENSTTEYSCEVEAYSNELGSRKLIAWVKLPVISSSVDTEFYIYYGNHSRKRRSSPEDVWDSNFAGVWHLSDETSSTTLDSTGNDNDMGKIAANEPIETDGKMLKAQQFDKSNDRIYRTSTDSLNLTTAFTLSAWVYPVLDATSESEWIIVKNSSASANAQYGFLIAGTTTVGNITVYIDGNIKSIGTSNVARNAWCQLVITWNGTTLYSYVNGAYLGTSSHSTSLAINGSFINIGGRSNAINGSTSAYVLNGSIDEARISNIARSADWIATEYNNQNDPDSFYSIIIES